jgi:serine protease Do
VDREVDLALLRARSAFTETALSLADDGNLRRGDWLVSIGNAGGLLDAVSVGVLSARGRVPEAALMGQKLVDYVFTDAAISPGASGGPVLDLEGRVVGINAALVGASRGLGVVIPGGLAIPVLEHLKRDGRVAHGFAGLDVVDVVHGSAGSVRVTTVFPKGPAEAANIRVGDLIIAVDGATPRSARDFRLRVFSSTPGSELRVQLMRSGAPTQVVLTLKDLAEAKQQP